ncbi:hypothetical protein R0J87_13505 [Halomonas sp. SIMBA_159]
MASIVPAGASVPAGALVYMPFEAKRGYVRASGQKLDANEAPGLRGVFAKRGSKIGDSQVLKTFSFGNGSVLAVSKSGQYAALGGRTTGALELIDLNTGSIDELTSVPLGDFESARALAFSDDETLLAVSGDNGVHIVNVETRALEQEITLTQGDACAFNKTGDKLAVSYGVGIEIYETATWAKIHDMPLQQAIALTFSNNGEYVAIVHKRDTVPDTPNNMLTVAKMVGGSVELSNVFEGLEHEEHTAGGFVSFDSNDQQVIAGVYRTSLNDPATGKSVKVDVGEWSEVEITGEKLAYAEFLSVAGQEFVLTSNVNGKLEMRDSQGFTVFDEQQVLDGLIKPSHGKEARFYYVDGSKIQAVSIEAADYYALPNVPSNEFGGLEFNAFIKV